MPQVVLRTGVTGADGREEILTEYMCDWPDCPNVAVHVLGVVRDLRACTAVCDAHLASLDARNRHDSAPR
jgi:hypothetical protein